MLSPPIAFAAGGDIASRFPVDDEDPAAHIPTETERNEHPVEFGYFLQDLVARAEGAFEERNWERAARYYEALAMAVPERATAFSKLCIAYDMLGQSDEALYNCREAMSRDGARVMDHTRFLKLSLNQPLDDKAIEEIEASLEHLRESVKQAPAEAESPGHSAPLEPGEQQLPLSTQISLYECKLAAVTKDVPRLDGCITELEKAKIEPRVVLGFRWARAAAGANQEALADVLERAHSLGLSEAAIAKLRGAYTASVTSTEASTVEPAATTAIPARTDAPASTDGPTSSDGVATAAPHPHRDYSVLLGTSALVIVMAGGSLLVFRRKKRAGSARAAAAQSRS